MKVVIIGASHGGNTAAIHLMKRNPNCEVILIEKNEFHSFISSGINLVMKNIVPTLEEANLYHKNDLLSLGINLMENCEVTTISPEKKEVHYTDLKTNEVNTLTYDYLILATGASQNQVDFGFLADPRFISYKSFAEAVVDLNTLQLAKRVLIIGAGFIGLELADWLGQDKQVFLVEQMERPLLRYFDEEFLLPIFKHLPENLTIKLSNSVLNITENKLGTLDAHLLSGEIIENVDCIVSAVNGSPNSAFLQNTVETAFDGPVIVNDYLQTSDPFIYAIGDLIEQHFLSKNLENNRFFLPLVSNALRSALTAAENILTDNTQIYAPSNRTIVTKFGSYYLASSGMNHLDALSHQLNLRNIVKVFSPEDLTENKEEFVYGKLQLTFRKDEQEVEHIVGAQLVSNNRLLIESINLISLMIQDKLTPWEILQTDFYFHPEFKPYVHLIKQLVLDDMYENS